MLNFFFFKIKLTHRDKVFVLGSEIPKDLCKKN